MTPAGAPFGFELERRGERHVLSLRGRLDTADTAALHGALTEAFERAAPRRADDDPQRDDPGREDPERDESQRDESGDASGRGRPRPRPAPLVVDLSAVERLEGAGAALLVGHVARLRQRGGEAELQGAPPQVARQIELYECGDDQGCFKAAPRCEGVFEQIGAAVWGFGRELLATLSFLGELTRAVGFAIARPRTVPWSDTLPLVNRAGADGLPIVVLINFLVGFTIALSGAGILARYGANVFVAELVGLSIVRELGPLMTAIVVAGRSGAAYAAELGTMKVGEEVDALRTMSLEPMRYLVVPRLAALVIAVPLLTVVANLVAVLGGALIAVSRLDLTTKIFFGRLEDSLAIGDLVFGLVKSAVFALAIGMVACQRGLRTRGGAAGVGTSTTSAVVVALFLLVGINAGFAALAELMGW